MRVSLPSRRIEADSPACGVQRGFRQITSMKATWTAHVSCISHLASCYWESIDTIPRNSMSLTLNLHTDCCTEAPAEHLTPQDGTEMA